MSEIPEWLLVHEITLEDHLGVNGRGEDVYAEPVTLPAFVEPGRRLVRDRTTGDMVESTSVVYIAPRSPVPSPDARITLMDGTTPDIMDVRNRDGGGLPTPDHIEIVCR